MRRADLIIFFEKGGAKGRITENKMIAAHLTQEEVCLRISFSVDFVRTEGQDYEAGDDDGLGKELGLDGFEQVGQCHFLFISRKVFPLTLFKTST
jgi:hypothetical protein